MADFNSIKWIIENRHFEFIFRVWMHSYVLSSFGSRSKWIGSMIHLFQNEDEWCYLSNPSNGIIVFTSNQPILEKVTLPCVPFERYHSSSLLADPDFFIQILFILLNWKRIQNLWSNNYHYCSINCHTPSKLTELVKILFVHSILKTIIFNVSTRSISSKTCDNCFSSTITN